MLQTHATPGGHHASYGRLWSSAGAHLLPILLPLVLFLLLACFGLDRPGLHYDEALEAGLPAVELLNGQPVQIINNAVLHVGRWTVPLMVQNHIGAIQVFAALPFILVGGPQAAPLRAMTVVSGAVTIIATYLFVTQVYGRLAALVASLWLATFASFVFWSRQGVFVTSLAPCFAMCALAVGAHWWQIRRVWSAGLAGLFVGLAIYSKLSALWLVNGVILWGALSALVTLMRHRRANRAVHGIVHPGILFDAPTDIPALDWRMLIVALAGLLVGCWPLLLYNVLTGGATLRVVEINATHTYLGTSNIDVWDNLQTRIAQAADVIRSGDHLWYLGKSFPNSIALVSVLVALTIIGVSLVLARGRGWRGLLMIPFLSLMVIIQSCYTISALWPTHFAIATPLPAIIVGIAVSQAYQWGRGDGWARIIARWLIVLLTIVVITSQVVTSLRYLRAVTTSGGLSFHSAAIYDLSKFLDGRSQHVVALDWGIAAPVQYLTGGRIQVEEFYGYEQDVPKNFDAELRKRFDRNELYVTHAEYQEAFQRRDAFLSAVAKAGLKAERINVSIRADGWPMLEVWQVRRP